MKNIKKKTVTKKYPDGAKYIGEFKDDKYHGQGTLKFADGEKYIGEFKDDKRHGQGTYTSPDGTKYVGEWKDGKVVKWKKYSYYLLMLLTNSIS